MARRDDSEASKQLNMVTNFLEQSSNQESCASLRSSGCIQILVQTLHGGNASAGGVQEDSELLVRTRQYAGQALHNIVHGNVDEKEQRREVKILRLLDQILEYSNFLKTLLRSGGEAIADDDDRHPLAAISLLMKASFEEENRLTMSELGALKAIPNLVHLDYAVHGPHLCATKSCSLLRRYALMALTNLTYGDGNNKAYICGQKQFMEVAIALLDAAPDDVVLVAAGVLRNLSWRADTNMKTMFNEIGAVTALAQAAMRNVNNENTLKAILSAVWNLSAHCSTNKAEFCAVNGALLFLVKMLSYEGPSKTLKIVENAGGILLNLSSHIAVCEIYRQILRENNCLSILLQHLKLDNVTVVTNACGTLSNLAARCPKDQKYLLDHGALPLLRSLGNSKNVMIVQDSAVALRKLIIFRNDFEVQKEQDQEAATTDLKSNSEPLKRRFSKIIEPNEREPQQQQHSLQANSSTASLPRPIIGKTSKSPNSVNSAKSDSAAIQQISTSQLRFGETRSLPRPEKRQLPIEAMDVTVEQPIDYSTKYNEQQNKPTQKPIFKFLPKQESPRSFYQETDLDQPTNFSIMYSEDESKPKPMPAAMATAMPAMTTTRSNDELSHIFDNGLKQRQQSERNEEEQGRRKQLKSSSDGDLRAFNSCPADIFSITARPQRLEILAPAGKYLKTDGGSNTPERPTHYCEEGTPGYFSRYDSLNSVVNMNNNNETIVAQAEDQHEQSNDDGSIITIATDQHLQTHQQPLTNEPQKKLVTDDQKQAAMSMLGSAMETPLMFSRHSSMDSLVIDDEGQCDDNFSVTSDYSRLQSGVISPLPDSPTQSMPHFSHQQQQQQQLLQQQQHQQQQQQHVPSTSGGMPSEAFSMQLLSMHNKRKPIYNVFDDNINAFQMESTPAQFSRATSLSNMSIMDDDNNVLPIETSNNNLNSDRRDSMAMSIDNATSANSTPSTRGAVKKPVSYTKTAYRKVCYGFRGMKLESQPDDMRRQLADEDAISKMRRGGPGALPGYLPIRDEMNKYGVENSPCTYSIISDLSNLTVESGFAGPARTLKEIKMEIETPNDEQPPALPERKPQPAPPAQNSNSLSSLSMDSDDDPVVLNHAIAIGSHRENSNASNMSAMETALSMPSDARESMETPTGLQQHAKTSSSTDSDSLDDAVFKQSIQSGMHKSSDALSEVQQERHRPGSQLATNNNCSNKKLPIAGFSENKNKNNNNNISNRRQMKFYATLSPPRRRHARFFQQDKRPFPESIKNGMPQRRPRCSNRLRKASGGSGGSGSGGDAQETCVSNQVRNHEDMLTSTSTSLMASDGSELTNDGNMQHWI